MLTVENNLVVGNPYCTEGEAPSSDNNLATLLEEAEGVAANRACCHSKLCHELGSSVRKHNKSQVSI